MPVFVQGSSVAARLACLVFALSAVSVGTVQAVTKATCVLMPGGSSTVTGTITFTQSTATGETTLSGQINGLTPGHHGFHVHQFGDYSNGCGSFGGHFNPDGQTHGGPDMAIRHAGDVGNIVAGDDGVATIDIKDGYIPLSGENSILGRGIVVHAKKDDLGEGGDAGSKKTGNAGARLACCVIGLAK